MPQLLQHNNYCTCRRDLQWRVPSSTTIFILLSIAAVIITTIDASTIVDPHSRFVRVDGADDADTDVAVARRHVTTGMTMTDPGLRNAMSGLRDALSDTRRILDGEDSMQQQQKQQQEEETNTKQQQEKEDTKNNEGRTSHHHPSSDWWERLYQGGPLYDETTGKLIEETTNGNGGMGNVHPANRRSHSATVYRQTVTNKEEDDDGERDKREESERKPQQEWMIISGGFTDDDWNLFPVWAYDLTSSRSIDEVEDEIAGNDQPWLTEEDRQKQGRNVLWVDLTPLPKAGEMHYYGADGKEMDATTLNEGANSSSSSIKNDNPQGRVGHLSSVHNDCLYIFGGLTYRMGSFHVDYPSSDDNDSASSTGGGEEEPIAIWKACGLDKLLDGDVKENGAGKGLKWERVVAEVDTGLPVPPEDGASGDDVANEENGNEDEEEDASHGNWRRNNQRTLSAIGHNHHRNNNNSTLVHQHKKNRNAVLAPDPSYTLPRGEAQGGHYHPQSAASEGGSTTPTNDGESFVFYGGMHHQHASLSETTTASGQQATTILGDVWKFDYEEETLRMLSPYPPLSWQRDERNGGFPKARTAHAATIVNHQLILHGGMHFGGLDGYDDNSLDTKPSSFSSPSNTYATYKTSSHWQPLSDVWVFDLRTLKWKERMQYPQLARSYHSMVGWGNGTVAAFGGFQQDTNIPGETVAFVFKDLLLSRPNETNWQKLMMPGSGNQKQMSPWRTSSEYASRPGITNRLEHTAIVDQYGSMYIWGGRFQTVSQIVGLWRLDLFTQDAKLRYEVAPPDGIEEYEAELEALHMFIATMMFMSLTISSLFSMMRRNGADVDDGGDGGGGGRSLRTRRGGLSRQVIDSLPLKRYEAAPTAEVTDDGDVVEDVSLSRENSLEDNNDPATLEENLECCPICLVPYEVGVSEIRTLPCHHVFCKECVDAWFSDHTTCPSCRQNIDDVADPSAEDDEATRRSAHAATTGRWRYHSHWGSNIDPVISTDDSEEEGTTPRTTRGRWVQYSSDDDSSDDDAINVIQEQYENEPRWQFITAFDAIGRRRHSHWNNRQAGEQSTTLDVGADAVSDGSSQTSNGEERTTPSTAHVEDHDHSMMGSIIAPRFLGIRRFFSRRGHVGVMAVPREDDGEDEEPEAIELV